MTVGLRLRVSPYPSLILVFLSVKQGKAIIPVLQHID